MEITYTKVGDYFLPDLTLPPEKENVTLGKYGRMRLTFSKRTSESPIFINVNERNFKEPSV